MEKIFKRSAIHNLIISDFEETNEINEGIVIPRYILESCDIIEFEQIIVTKISGDNWRNRIRTFAIPGEDNRVIVRGGLTKFFSIGDLTCIISYTKFSEEEFNTFCSDKFPILDIGFDPNPLKYDITKPKLLHEFFSGKKQIQVEGLHRLIDIRKSFKRIILSNLIVGLKINKTHPDCLHGSAELPKSIMEAADMKQYQHVVVYNCSFGGAADTYAVPMPEGTVMTTGAMAKFAKLGDIVNVSSYIETFSEYSPIIIFTNGTNIN